MNAVARRPLRVLLIESETHILGGGHLSLLTLIRGFNPETVQPTVVSLGESPFVDRLAESGIPCRVITRRGGLRDLALLFSLAKAARDADLVHVNTLDIRAGLAARLAFRPLVGHLRVIFSFTWVGRWFVRLAHRVIAVSEAVRDTFCVGYDHLLPRFQVIPNTVELDSDPPALSLRVEMGLSENALIVGAVARIDPWKGLHTFVSAALLLASEREDVVFLIAGSADPEDAEAGAYESRLRREVESKGMTHRIRFLGFRRDAQAIIQQLDVLVVPSTVVRTAHGEKTEGFGRVVIEAMALGTPVVATRVGGIPEIVLDGETGTLVEPDDADGIAQAVSRLLEAPDLRRRQTEAGRFRFEAFYSLPAHLRRIEALYRELTGFDPAGVDP